MKKLIFIFIIYFAFNPLQALTQASNFKKIDSLRLEVINHKNIGNKDSISLILFEINKIVLSMSAENLAEYEYENLIKSTFLEDQLKIEEAKSKLQSLILLIISILGFIYLIYYTDKNSRVEKQNKIIAAKNISSYDLLLKNKASEKLHDDIGGSLAGLKMRLTQLNDPDYYSSLKNEIKILDKIYDEVRSLSKDLNVKNKFSNNLEEVLENLVEEMCTSFQNVELNIFPKAKLNNIKDQEFINALALTAKELITNIIKHAKAQNITIDLTAHKDYIVFIISDDGTGFNNNKFGLGLKNIEDRAVFYGGKMIIDTNAKNGTIITVKLLYDFN